MLKKIALAMSLAFALTGAAGCKKDDAAKKDDKKADKKDGDKKDPKAADPKATDTAKTADPAAKTADTAVNAAAGLQKNAMDMAGGSGIEKFSLGDTKAPGCDQYAKDVTPFFTELQSEYKTLQDDMNTKGADAFDRFGQFLKKGAGTLKGVKTDAALTDAHTALVSSISDMGDAFLEVAAAVRANDQAAGQKALDHVKSASTTVGAAFDKLKSVCAS
jgi:hypothetical protein